ncbi:MAG: hypothetical protein HUU25_01055 [Candidatus Sumerlaeia bacterium]|nr:hypothetical protein [Candidatus Sumerlaeia bacterium]
MRPVTSALGWNAGPLTDLEWHCLHARRPLPLGALSVWVALTLYAVALSFPVATLPSLSPGLARAVGDLPFARLLLSPVFWMQALLFWLLPWILLERRMRYRGNSLPELEAKAAAIMRLYAYALACYPLLRLGSFGMLHLVRRGAPAPTHVDMILFDVSQPMLIRYVAALGVTALFGLVTWTVVVSRLRLAQWAAMSTPGRFDRFVAYSITTGVFVLFLGLLKRNIYDPLTPSGLLPDHKLEHFLTNLFPWALIVMTVSIAVAAGAHLAARRRVGLF